MDTILPLLSRVFDVVLAPFGHRLAAFDLLFWPVLAGVVALLVYKAVSNQAGIARAKRRIQVHLLEVVLFRDDLIGVLASTGKALFQNAAYLGHNVVPMLVMIVPMMAILVQIVAHYAYEPREVGAPVLLTAKLSPDAGVKPAEVRLVLPPEVVLDAPPVRTADREVVWRLKPTTPGDHVLAVEVAGRRYEKGIAVGGDPRKIPVKRARTWEALLYPGEDPLPAGPIESLSLPYDTRPLPWLPDGEGGILAWFFVASLVAGFALKDRFGVTL